MNTYQAIPTAAYEDPWALLIGTIERAGSLTDLLDAVLNGMEMLIDVGTGLRGALLLWDGSAALTQVVSRDCEIADLAVGTIPSQALQLSADTGLAILPLFEADRCFGALALYITSSRHMNIADLASLEAMIPILSLALSRRLLVSVIEFREFEIQFAELESLHRLTIAEELRDLNTSLHVLRVAHYCKAIAEAAGLDAETTNLLFQAAPMHDVGKICIPDALLLSPQRLTESEFKEIKRHTLFGEQILTGNSKIIDAARVIAGSHHERWDGNGYPRGLAGHHIPLFGRICAIADVFDALGSERSYKPAWEIEEILNYLRRQAGVQFEPDLIDAFFAALPKSFASVASTATIS